LGLTVREETPEDNEAVGEVHRQAFGRADEARLVDALRDGGYARLSLVAEEVGRVVGHVLFSDLPIVTQAGTLHALAWPAGGRCGRGDTEGIVLGGGKHGGRRVRFIVHPRPRPAPGQRVRVRVCDVEFLT
jgi:hypothetical protein